MLLLRNVASFCITDVKVAGVLLWAFKHRNGIDGVIAFTTSNHIGESRHGFYDVKFDHVTSRDTMLFMEIWTTFQVYGFITTLHQKCKYKTIEESFTTPLRRRAVVLSI